MRTFYLTLLIAVLSLPGWSQTTYCASGATSSTKGEIVNVEIGTWNNYSGPTTGMKYSDFTTIQGPILPIGDSFNISITSGLALGWTNPDLCCVEVYIDYNFDGIYSEPNEIVFGASTAISYTSAGYFVVPNTVLPGTTGMRVVLQGTSSVSDVYPCGSYNWGETEDYLITLVPKIQFDAGVTSIINPVENNFANFSSPVEVCVQNFGLDTLFNISINYEINGGPPLTYAFTSPVAPSQFQNVILPNFSFPAGNFELCAYTVLAGDSNTINDSTCISLVGTLQHEAEIISIDAPVSSCDMGFEDVTVTLANLGDTIVPGNLEISYLHQFLTSPVTESYQDTMFPFDTVDFTFSTPVDLSVNVYTMFEFSAWIDLVGDTIQTNDTTSASAWSGLTPADPTPVNQTIWSGTSASLTVTPIDTNLSYFWYDSIDGNILFFGPEYNTPTLFDTTSYVLKASSTSYGDIQVGTSNSITGIHTYPNPYSTWYWGNREQFLIRANELIALGFADGNIYSVAFNAIALGSQTLGNFTIYIGSTSAAELTGWQPGLNQVFFDAAYMPTLGWNTHEFSTPFYWDGVSNVVIETCLSNSSYSSGYTIEFTSTSWYSTCVYRADNATVCSSTNVSFNNGARPNMILNTLVPDCSANPVVVTANVQYADFDVAIWALISPVSDYYLGMEEVVVKVYNNGLNTISNFPMKYSVDGGTVVVDSFTDTLQPGEMQLFTFSQQPDLSSYNTYSLCVWSDLINDGLNMNDTLCVEISNYPPDGETCESAYPYLYLNYPPVNGETTFAGDADWWRFDLPSGGHDVYISLCGSSFNTSLKVFSACGTGNIGFNDNSCGLQSELYYSYMPAGSYFVRVYGFSTNFGTYTLQITGRLISLEAPASGCDLAYEDVTVSIHNLTDTIYPGNLEISYTHQFLASPVTEIFPDTVYPFDSISYTFNTQVDLSANVNTAFNLLVWCEIGGDSILSNDTISNTIWSIITPLAPTVNSVSIMSGENATLSPVNPDNTLLYYWYDSDTLLQGIGQQFTTPILFDTTTYLIHSVTNTVNTCAVACTSQFSPVTVTVGYADFDVSTWDIVSPLTGSYLGIEDVVVEVYNNGLYPVANFPMQYSMDAGIAVVDTFADTLQPGEMQLFTFSEEVNLTAYDTFHICVWSAHSSDSLSYNDTTCIEVINIEGDGETCTTAWNYGQIGDPYVTGTLTSASDADWWKVTVTGSSFTGYFDLFGSNFDTYLEVYYGSCSLYPLWENNDNNSCCLGSEQSFIEQNLSAGTYYVRISGYNNEFGNYQLHTGQSADPVPYFINYSVYDISCNGQSDGAINLSITPIIPPATLPFTYLWNTGNATLNLSGLSASTYCITITDATGIPYIPDCITITEPPSLNLTMSVSDVSTLAAQDGSIDLSVQGGTSPYSFTWSNGAITEDLINISEGDYSVTVIDNHSCEASEEFFVFHNAPDTQMIVLNAGWNMFSTYKMIQYPNLDSLLSPIQGNFYLVKNWEGEVFWPQYYVNTIDPVELEYGFQIKMMVDDTLELTGQTYIPENLVINLPAGWSMIGYPRYIDGPISELMSSAVSHILIMKDDDGGVYWPVYGVNQINLMKPGEAYQIKTDAAIGFNFPSYLENH
ncbi:MAG: SprB repeat-containing protein [Bacteroidales bacterium]|nr:SprB repeat-containing protein [Bacteroidales bacterium]MCF8458148.1 SprB repeat-containing protein [Bacteroidales bacterium]